jgi:hypothetical protein
MITIAWSLWGVLLLGVLYMSVRLATERTSSPEAGPGLGLFLVLLLLGVLAGLAGLLVWAGRRQSSGGLILLMILLAYPLVMLIARPIVIGYKQYRWDKEDAQHGDFREKTLAAMVAAIRKGDVATLKGLLGGKAPPAGKDRAGNDLLAYTVALVRQQERGIDLVRALLDAGADVKTSRSGENVDVLNIASPPTSDTTRELMRLLLERGADPNAVDPRLGDTPIRNAYDDLGALKMLVEYGADIDHIQSDGVPAVVNYISTQKWDMALYLIEKGARLDVVNTHGLSVDYYLKDWKESVYGNHPEGWDRVRKAIEARR